LIVIDASVWVSDSVLGDEFHVASRRWLRRNLRRQEIRAPAIVLPEVSGAVSRRTGSPLQGDQTVRDLMAIPRLRILDVDADLAHLAARFAADLDLRGADAVYVVTAVRLHCPLVTWDAEMIRKTSGVIEARQPST